MSIDDQLRSWIGDYGNHNSDVATLLCDRHDPSATAFKVVDPSDWAGYDLTYGDLEDRSRRMARVLRGRGIAAGDRIPVLIGRSPELVITLLALWRLGAVHVPLFTAFASGAIEVRLMSSEAEVVITESSQRSKLESFHAIEIIELDSAFDDEVAAAEPLRDNVAVGGDGIMVQIYTSGTTGKPKGVPVPARALAAFHSYMEHGLDVQEGDVFWNAADPGWAYGLYYGVIGPLVSGRANLLLKGSFAPHTAHEVLRRYNVTNFAGAPTIYRALEQIGSLDHIALRRASSAGEPLTPDVIDWGRSALGLEVRDHFGQTEVGMVVGNAWHDDLRRELRDGSMGGALPGFRVDVVDNQIAVNVTDSELLWFERYVGAPAKTQDRFTEDGAWYLTSDVGRIDDDGYIYFASRDDDVILAAGYRIGPFEVESVLATHSAVAEVAVVGRPDPDGVRGEQVEAFVVLRAGFDESDSLARQLQEHVRTTYSKHVYPRRVWFVESLPKTPSGKVQRYILRDK